MPPKLPSRLVTTLLSNSTRPVINRSVYPSLCARSVVLRHLSTSPPLLKKGGGKQEQKRTIEVNLAKTAGKDDAHDFSGFQYEIEKATSFLKGELARLRAGGLDLEAIEELKVSLSAPSGGGGGGLKKDGARSGGKKGNMAKLGDVAQVVPRGRTVVIMVGEKEHLKPVSSALQSSAMNLQPKAPPLTAFSASDFASTTQLELHVPMPPTTTESRQTASGVATQKGEAAFFTLNQARSAEKKRLRALHLARKVGPDDLRRAEKEMEKINKDSQAAMEKLVRERKRTLEGG